MLLKLADKQRERFAQGRRERGRTRDRAKRAEGRAAGRASRPTSAAAYTVVARVLLNLDETITKE